MIQALAFFPALPSTDQGVRPPDGQDNDPSALQPANGSAVSAVGSLLPQIHITKRRLKQLEAIALIREQRDNGKQQLAYNARPFVLCGIPVRHPRQQELVYLRRNGKFFLEITGHPRFGLHYGQDRLIPNWIATLALQQRSRFVRFPSAAQMLEFFHLSKVGRHYRRIASQAPAISRVPSEC